MRPELYGLPKGFTAENAEDAELLPVLGYLRRPLKSVLKIGDASVAYQPVSAFSAFPRLIAVAGEFEKCH